MSDDLTSVKLPESEVSPLFQRCLLSVRPELQDDTYVLEALRVLRVGGYRSAIGALWNAVVDDLRNKIMFRSLEMFNKAIPQRREVKTYEDFQNFVNDDDLIDGAYKIGVIGWEASKILKHAKETRHIFSGHPKSTEPSVVKVLAMFDDCVKYVLRAEFPNQIINLDEYLSVLVTTEFDRNPVAIENAIGDLPEVYKVELANRLFSAYVVPDGSTVLTSNIELVAPILWNVLDKPTKVQVVRRVDQIITKGNAASTDRAFEFVKKVAALHYLSVTARRYKIDPIVKQLTENRHQFRAEDECVGMLEPYAAFVPLETVGAYVSALVHTYVGFVGGSAYSGRTDFYANGASVLIPKMFQLFDDRAGDEFVTVVRSSSSLHSVLHNPRKLQRLRSLGNIVSERVSDSFAGREFLRLLLDPTREADFFKAIRG